MRPQRTIAVLSAMACALVLVGGSTAAEATTPYCGFRWGSLPKSSPEMTGAPIVGVRVGTHGCFDRLVIDLGGKPGGGYEVRYTDGLYNQDTGERVPVAGGPTLMVTARGPAYGPDGQLTVAWQWRTHIVTPAQFDAGGFPTFRDLVYAGTYEGQTNFALGVRARLPFRVFGLDGPGNGSRLVIDVAHRW